MKKRMGIIALLVIVMVLSACNAGHGLDSESKTERTASPTVAPPINEPVVVYSLHSDHLIEKIISLGYGKNVQLVVGTEAGISEQDAIRRLSTELLAGAGPDVIVMDGLPIDSYAEKGAIADLSQALPEGLLPNIRAAYEKEDGSVYAIPIRIKLPTLLGEDIDEVETLSDIAGWLEEKDSIYWDADVQDFYTIFGNRWMMEGELNEPAFREDMEGIARIVAPLRELGLDIPYEGKKADFLPWGQASSWHLFGFPAGVIGNYGSLKMLGAPFVVIPFHDNAQFKPLGESVFIPCSTLAVNSQSKQIERAMGFVKTCLASELQVIDTGDNNYDNGENYGFPVNEVMFRVKIGELPDPPKKMGINYAHPDGVQWEEPWYDRTPTYEEALSVFAIIQTLTVPAPMDYALRDIFLSQAKNYLDGNGSMDEIVSALRAKLQLYMAE